MNESGSAVARKPKTVAKRKKKGDVHIRQDWCKGCGFCVEFCPSDVLAMSPEFNARGYHHPVAENPENCSGCDLCGMYCPEFSIWGTKEPKTQENKKKK